MLTIGALPAFQATKLEERLTAEPASIAAMNPIALPPGVEIHGKALRINFTYQGIRCREIVAREQIDRVAIIMAGRQRDQIVRDIKAGTFDYQKHFPESKTAQRLYEAKVDQGNGISSNDLRNLSRMTVAEGVEAWLMTQIMGKSKSTATNYRSRSTHVLSAFGDRYLADVTTQELQQFRNKLVRSRANPVGLSPKTANDVLTVVRGVWEDARKNDITHANRADGLTNHRLENSNSADPFELDEMQRLLSADPQNMAPARMVVCNCWLGLSRSELTALAAEDIDLVRRKITVRRAFVQGEHKAPKVQSREREIDLLEPAVDLLHQILEDSRHAPSVEITVTRLDNLSIATEHVRLLFNNPKTGKHWSQSALDRWFKTHTAKAGVRYRGINQCRHTFASRALSNYAKPQWLVRQLGHTDDQMLKKHYSKWMPSEMGDASPAVIALDRALRDKWNVHRGQSIVEAQSTHN